MDDKYYGSSDPCQCVEGICHNHIISEDTACCEYCDNNCDQGE